MDIDGLDRERKVQQGQDMTATLYLWNSRDCYFVPINNNRTDNSIFPAIMQLHPIQDVVTSPRRPVHTPSYRVVESNEPSLASHSGSSQLQSACHLSWLSVYSHALSAVKSTISRLLYRSPIKRSLSGSAYDVHF